MKIENARISRTHLGNEDHGIFTASLFIDASYYSGSYGGFDLRSGAADYLSKLLTTLDVQSWEKLQGQLVRVASSSGSSMWLAIGHIIDDRWFVCDAAGPRIVTEADLNYELSRRTKL